MTDNAMPNRNSERPAEQGRNRCHRVINIITVHHQLNLPQCLSTEKSTDINRFVPECTSLFAGNSSYCQAHAFELWSLDTRRGHSHTSVLSTRVHQVIKWVGGGLWALFRFLFYSCSMAMWPGRSPVSYFYMLQFCFRFLCFFCDVFVLIYLWFNDCKSLKTNKTYKKKKKKKKL